MATPNPYAPPTAQVQDLPESDVAPPLWNPSAAGCWSLLFSPVFGAYLHMKNWEALGEAEKAAASKKWAVGSLIAIVGLALALTLLPENKILDAVTRPFGIALVIGWHSAIGKSQHDYVKERFGKTYERRGWLKPIAIALLATVGVLFAIGVLVIAASWV